MFFYLMKDDFFVENSESQKNGFSWVFTESLDGFIWL